MIVHETDKDTVFAAYQNFHCADPQASCQQPVESCWSASALDVTENCRAKFETQLMFMLFEIFREAVGIIRRAFRDNDERMVLSALVGCDNSLRDILGSEFEFRYDDRFGPARKPRH